MTEIARGEIRVEVDDERALADLARIDDAFERSMKKIDEADAVVDLGADHKQLKKDLDKAEKDFNAYQKRIDKMDKGGARAAMERKRDRLLAELKLQRAEEEGARKRLEASKEAAREDKKAEQRVRLIEKAEKARAAVFTRLEREKQAELRRTSAFEARMARQREREFNQAHSWAVKLNRERDQGIALLERERRMIPTLTRQYAELVTKIERLNRARSRSRGDRQAQQIVDFKIAEVEAKAREIHERIQRVLGPVEIAIHFPGRDLGNRIRAIRNDRNVLVAAGALGGALGVELGRGLGRTLNLRNLVGGIGGAGVRLLGKVGNLSQMTVRLGPFTATIRQAITAVGILAPLVIDLVGSLGALAGAAGSAALGLGAIGIAMAGGAIPALVGFFTVLKPVVGEISNAVKASKAYNDAVLKYGKNSDQAKTKLEILNRVMKGQSAETRKAFLAAGNLSDRWAEITKPSRAAAWRVIGEGLKYASDNAEFFGRRTNDSFAVAERGVTRWLKALGSREGRNVLGDMMDNFNTALGPALDGLGDLLAYLGKVGQVASRFLPDMAQGFRQWARDLLHTTDNTAEFEGKVTRTINSLRSVGRFIMSTGRLLKTFFGGGVESGVKLFDDMAAAMDRWRRSLQTASGQQDLQLFFERSASGAQSLFSVVAPLVRTFVQWAAALAPVVQAFTSVLGPMAAFAAGLVRLVALQGPIQALIATLGVLWGISKVTAATRAVQGFAGALFGVSRAQKAVAATSAAAAAAGGMGPAGMFIGGRGAQAARGASTVATNMSRGAKAAGFFRAALTGVGGALGVANPLFGAAALATAGLVVAFSLSSSAADKAKEAFYAAGQSASESATAYRDNASIVGDTASAHKRAVIAVRQARDRLAETKKGTDEYKLALLDLRDAQRYAHRTGQDLITQNENIRKSAGAQVKAERDRLKAFDDRTKRAREAAAWEAKNAASDARRAAAAQRLAAIDAKRAPLVDAVNRALNRQAAANLNIQRSAAGLLPVLGQAEQRLGALARRSRSAAVKIALKFDAPQDVSRVAANASRALRSGVPNRIVTRIIADSSNADQAVRRLQNATITPKKLRILQTGGEAAVAMLQRIIGRKLTPKQQKIAQSGGPGVIALLQRITGVRIPNKSFTINGNNGPAMSAISSVLGALSQIPVVKTITTVFKTVGKPGGRARGRGAIGSETALVGEGRGPEILANATTGAMSIVSSPTVVGLAPDDFVIPTEARFRTRGRQLWAQFAGEDMPFPNIPAYRKGKAPLKPKYIKGRGSSVEGLKWVKEYEKWQGIEDDRNREISIARSRVREPESFIRQTGTDAEGNPTYSIDQGAIDTYTNQLDAVRQLVDSLISPGGVLDQLQHAATQAYKQLASYVKDRKANINVLEDTMARNKRLFKSKDDDTKRTARARYDRAAEMIRSERSSIADANDMDKRIREDQHDALYRRQEYSIDSGDLTHDINAIYPNAVRDRDQSNPTPQPPTPPDTPETAPLPAQQFILNEARGQLLKEFGSNFVAATARNMAAIGSQLTSASPSVPSLMSSGSGGGSRAASMPVSGGIAAAGAMSTTTAIRTAQSFASAPNVAGVAVGGGGGDKVINVTNNYLTQPEDPHTWSRGLAYELQSAI